MPPKEAPEKRTIFLSEKKSSLRRDVDRVRIWDWLITARNTSSSSSRIASSFRCLLFLHFFSPITSYISALCCALHSPWLLRVITSFWYLSHRDTTESQSDLGMIHSYIWRCAVLHNLSVCGKHNFDCKKIIGNINKFYYLTWTRCECAPRS